MFYYGIVLFRDIKKSHEHRRIVLEQNSHDKKSGVFLSHAASQKNKKRPGIAIFEHALPASHEHLAHLLILFCGAVLVIVFFTAINLAHSGLRLKAEITLAAEAGFETISSGVLALKEKNFSSAEQLFLKASDEFKNVQAQVWFTKPVLPNIEIADPLFEASHALITAGSELSLAGSSFTSVMRNIQVLPQHFFEAQNAAEKSLYGESISQKLAEQIPHLSQALNSLKKADLAFSNIPLTLIPVEVRDRFEFGAQALKSIVDILQNTHEDLPAILTLLGDAEPHTFLLLLQNNAELRPSGGFIGNYVIAETNDGYLVKRELYDVYKADHQLAASIEPPAEIVPVNPQWFMRDSNYSGHFPLSAQKAMWFLEHEGGPGVDTVIAVDQTLFSELLRLTGPIKIPQLNLPLSAENFHTVISYIVEAKLSGKENPKEILAHFLPAFEKAFFSRVDPLDVTNALGLAIKEKHVLGFSRDKEVQAFLQKHGLAGEMKIPAGSEDYLNIVHTSIGGNKSDEYVHESIAHDTVITNDGSLINELTITRSHSWDPVATDKKIKEVLSAFGVPVPSREIFEILGRSPSVHALRIYVPFGSELLESSGEVKTLTDTELNATYFSTTIKVGVADTISTKIRYTLPFKLDLTPAASYKLTVQKQPGQKNIIFKKSISPENRVLHHAHFPKDLGLMGPDGVWRAQIELVEDRKITTIWGK